MIYPARFQRRVSIAYYVMLIPVMSIHSMIVIIIIIIIRAVPSHFLTNRIPHLLGTPQVKSFCTSIPPFIFHIPTHPLYLHFVDYTVYPPPHPPFPTIYPSTLTMQLAMHTRPFDLDVTFIKHSPSLILFAICTCHNHSHNQRLFSLSQIFLVHVDHE